MSKKLEVGDVLYRENKSRHREFTGISEVTVTKVGNKYFYVNNGRDPYAIETLDYTCKKYSQFNEQLYRTEQEIHDKNKKMELTRVLQDLFGGYRSPKLTLDQITRIHNILNEPK